MYDIAVIGGGPGGYVAALYAAMNGKEVILFEKKEVGGTCLNRGCIPTKALLASADVFRKIKKASSFGIETDGVRADFEKMFIRKDNIVEKLRKGIEFLIQKRKITLIRKKAELFQDNLIKDEEGNEYKASDVIIATGSEPSDIPGIKADGKHILNSDHALSMHEIPDNIVIIGGGIIGVEFASMYSSFGKKVTVVELCSEILPFCDKDIRKKMTLALKKSKVKVITGKKVSDISTEQGIKVTLEGGKTIDTEMVLLAAGRRLVLDAINIDIEYKDGFVGTDEKMRTNIPHVYAIGDIVSRHQLAHVASAQAMVAVQDILGKDTAFSYRAIPSCLYSIPEAAWVGLTEEEAREQEKDINIGIFRFSSLGKAVAAGEDDGFVKIICDKDDNILGAHLFGAKATELISELNTAYGSRLKNYELGSIIHAHPTMSEAIYEAVHDVHDMCVHNI